MFLVIQVSCSGESCLCDFTYDFYWQHKGTRLDPDQPVGGTSRRALVEALRRGETVHLVGDVGSRLGSSMGVDLMKFGGTGGPIDKTGCIILDGDAGSRLGISMLSGTIYLSGNARPPLGNVVEVLSDRTGYRKYVSVTKVLTFGGEVLEPNRIDERLLLLDDKVIRDTIGARGAASRELVVNGTLGMSTGILMQRGRIRVNGDCGENTGVLMRGGTLAVLGSAGSFTGAQMRGGDVFISGSAGAFTCARMRGGSVYARDGKPVSPAIASMPDAQELQQLIRVLGVNPLHAMMYKKFFVSRPLRDR